MTPETPGIAETAHFLRRFADLMSVGQNANYLHHAAVLLEDLTARLTAALRNNPLTPNPSRAQTFSHCGRLPRYEIFGLTC